MVEFIFEICIMSHRTNWSALENFRGSYSYRGALAYENKITNADLKEPLKNSQGDVKVLFAGEATSRSHFSTVHGGKIIRGRNSCLMISIYNLSFSY
jgi:Flavin containing amine oxidoreductase